MADTAANSHSLYCILFSLLEPDELNLKVDFLFSQRKRQVDDLTITCVNTAVEVFIVVRKMAWLVQQSFVNKLSVKMRGASETEAK